MKYTRTEFQFEVVEIKKKPNTSTGVLFWENKSPWVPYKPKLKVKGQLWLLTKISSESEHKT